MSFKATYLGSNGWIIEFSQSKIVIDPWLCGDLIFPPGEWFFKGTLEKDIPMPKDIDLILLTQGLPDHCHIPSLKLFSQDIEIICPKSALKILKELNFSSIRVIEPSEKLIFRDIKIEATSGAPVPQIENGYIVENKEGGFYIEPHGYFDKNIKSRKLDAVITPTKNLGLPIVGPFVKGAEVIPKLIDKFNPNFILSSTIGGDVKFSGLLNKFISVKDCQNKISCELIDLKTLQSINI
tara:strand:+ start:549 stop:1262 length:714 start_codon:yes stop_codon:yes gene_type:complete